MRRKILVAISVLALIMGIGVYPASAHVSMQPKGYTLQAGQSSRIWLSLGHGCTYRTYKYGTSVFVVQVPSAAGKPTPEFHQGFKTSVVASTTVETIPISRLKLGYTALRATLIVLPVKSTGVAPKLCKPPLISVEITTGKFNHGCTFSVPVTRVSWANDMDVFANKLINKII